MPTSRPLWFLLAVLSAVPLLAQRTINFTAAFTLGDSPPTRNYTRNLLGVASVGTLGNAVVILNRFQMMDDDYVPVGQVGGGITLVFNRLDQIMIANSGIPDPNATNVTVSGRVMNGSGIYAGANSPAGGTTLTLTRTSTSPLRYTIGLTGTATVGTQAVNLAIANASVTQVAANLGVFDNFTGTGTFDPGGAGTVTGSVRPNNNRWDDDTGFVEIVFTVTFSPADSVQFFLAPAVSDDFQAVPFIITGGTGVYSGAGGSGTMTLIDDDHGTLRGAINLPGPNTPVITSVNTASGGNPISQNDWIEIKGRNLVPANTPAGGMFWSNAPEFAQGRMPTELGGVSVTVNGKPAFVYWYCSAATTPACATDQINVLTPLDDHPGQAQVPIVVKNGPATSGSFIRIHNPVSPSLLLFAAKGDVVATHADGSLAAAATLFPGASTPPRRGETISLWGVGFGLPTTTLVNGSASQSGSLRTPLSCFFRGNPISVASALVSPGLYQFNLTIPDDAPAGLNHLYCAASETFVSPIVLIAVQ